MHARYFYSFTDVWMHYLFDILLYNSMVSYLRILCLHKWSYDYNIDICVYIFANIYANIVNYSRNIYCEFKFILYIHNRILQRTSVHLEQCSIYYEIWYIWYICMYVWFIHFKNIFYFLHICIMYSPSILQ